MLEQITLSHEGQRLPLKAVASTTVRDSQTLQVSVFNAEVSRRMLWGALHPCSGSHCCQNMDQALCPSALQLGMHVPTVTCVQPCPNPQNRMMQSQLLHSLILC